MRRYFSQGSLSPKQKKIASAAKPKDVINEKDFAVLRSDRVTAKKADLCITQLKMVVKQEKVFTII
jgi:hypothetical protein